MRKVRVMGKCNNAVTDYFADPVRAASLLNYCFGRKIADASSIENLSGFYSNMKWNNKLSFIQRDLLFKVHSVYGDFIVGLENQDKINLVFPIRQFEIHMQM